MEHSLEQIKKDIAKGNAKWIEAWKNQDAKALAAAFHPSGAILSDHGSMMHGRQAIIEGISKSMKRIGWAEFTIETIDVYHVDEDIYEKGRYTLKTEHTGASEGNFVVVWKYDEDGQLYFYRDIGI
jgi:uncharacterized protein (TIGR02246 family)